MTKSYCVTVKLLRRQRKFTLPRFWVLKRWVNGKGTKLMLSLGWETVIIFGTFEKKNREKKYRNLRCIAKQTISPSEAKWSLFLPFLSSFWVVSIYFTLVSFFFHFTFTFHCFWSTFVWFVFFGGGWLFFLIHFILCRISYIGMT